jgi:hypothetical protein
MPSLTTDSSCYDLHLQIINILEVLDNMVGELLAIMFHGKAMRK